MIDFVLGGALAALLVRGWLRGFVREAIGLGVVVVGTLLAFQLSTPAGAVVSAMAGTGADASRLIGGVAVFLLVSVGGGVASHVFHRGIRFLPGLPTVNRIAGAVFAGLAGLIVATVLVSALALLKLPEPLERAIGGSAIADTLIRPGAAPQQVLALVGGDRVAVTMLNLQDVVGERRLVASRDPVRLPGAAEEELSPVSKASGDLYDLVNESRVQMGVDPLTRSGALDGVALARARKVYASGDFVRRLDVEADVEQAGVPVVMATELLGLGVSSPSVHEGLVRDAEAARSLGSVDYRKVGVAVVDGPLGLVTVVVLAA